VLPKSLNNHFNQHKKLKVLMPKTDDFYLSSLPDFLKFMGWPSSTKQVIEALEKEYDVSSGVSVRSIYALENEGVAKPTAKKLVNFYNKLPNDFQEKLESLNRQKYFRYSRLNINLGEWSNFIAGVGAHSEFSVFAQVLQGRCDAYAGFIKEVKALKKGAGDLDGDDFLLSYALPFWQENSVIESQRLKAVFDVLSKNPESFPLDILQTVYQMKLDCYFSVVAAYLVSIFEFYGLKFNADDSLFVNVLNDFSSDTNSNTCVYFLLKNLALRQSDNDGHTGWRKLAQLLPVKSNDHSGENLSARQYKKLKEWRSGKFFPSNEELVIFSENLCESLDMANPEDLLMMFNFCHGFDVLLKQWSKDFEDRSVFFGLIRPVFKCFPIYLQVALETNNQS
jgi:hypothetical protein